MIKSWESAWEKIGFIYKSGKICSERHLQAELVHILYSDKEFMSKYVLHIEPKLHCANKDYDYKKIEGIVPDMLVTEGDKIVAHVELKYVPYGYIQYEKDITNFKNLYSYRETDLQILLMTDPINGNWDSQRVFTIDKTMIVIYAAITYYESNFITHGEKVWFLDEPELTEVPKYLFLIGTTDFETTPKFWTKTNISNNHFYKLNLS